MKKRGYRKGLAGYDLTRQVPLILESWTVAQTIKSIEKRIAQLETIDYIYVINAKNQLIGVFSSKSLYRRNKNIKVRDLCRPPFITIGPEENEENAAYLSLKYSISTIPVVDEHNAFLGVITRDKILAILHRKHLEDKFVRAGIHRAHVEYDNLLKTSTWQSVKHRILWLFIGLAGGFLAAHIIGSFEQILQQNLIIASFIPLVAYIANAVGTQLETFAIRDFALFRKVNFSKYFFKQLFIVFLIAIVLGTTATVMAAILYQQPHISFILGIAVFIAIISSIITGLFIPFQFRKWKSDPANGSGPIGTIVQDILSVTIYFLVATWLL